MSNFFFTLYYNITLYYYIYLSIFSNIIIGFQKCIFSACNICHRNVSPSFYTNVVGIYRYLNFWRNFLVSSLVPWGKGKLNKENITFSIYKIFVFQNNNLKNYCWKYYRHSQIPHFPPNIQSPSILTFKNFVCVHGLCI